MGIEREKGGWVARGINKMADDGEWREDTEITLTLLEKGHREKVGDSKKKKCLPPFSHRRKQERTLIKPLS